MSDESKGMHHTANPLAIEHRFFLNFPIEEADDFYEFFTTLQTASGDDVVFLHINSPGGYFNTMVQVMAAIENTQATVIGAAEGQVASAAAMIFFSCHGFQVSEHSDFLIHNGMAGAFGKPNDNVAAAGAHNKRSKKLLKKVLEPFFTREELRSIANGKEFYMDSEEVVERLNKALRKKEKQIAQEERADIDA